MTGAFKESDIRPDDLLREYLRLSVEDARNFFPDVSALSRRACPGCRSDEGAVLFEKNGFAIEQCGRCGTLFANPCPSAVELDPFYRDSISTRYWANVFFPAVAEARRSRIFAPRAERLLSVCSEHAIDLDVVIDVGAGSGVFLEELRKRKAALRCRAVEPGKDLAAQLIGKGFEVYEGFVEQLADEGSWNGSADAVVSFETIEHLPSPLTYFTALAKLVKVDGLVLVSGLGADGFDIQVLGEKSNSVAPPHHLTFLSRRGAEHILRDAGLELLAFETPGKLDVELVRKALLSDPDAVQDRFIRHVMIEANESVRDALQSFLVDHQLSSHMWIFARRRAA